MDYLDEQLECIRNPKYQLDLEEFYRTFGDSPDNQAFNFERIFHQLDELFECGKLEKHLIYLSLIGSGNTRWLNAFKQHDITKFILDPNDPISIYNYGLIFKKNWFLKSYCNKDHIDKWPSSVLHTILLVKFIDLYSNETNIQWEDLKSTLFTINPDYLTELEAYVFNNIVTSIETVDVCRDMCDNLDLKRIFNMAIKQMSLLDILSNCINLNSDENWRKIYWLLLRKSSGNCAEIFLSFTILHRIYNLILMNSYNSHCAINQEIEKIINDTHSLNDLKLEVLENIYSLIFAKHEKYICKERDIQTILYILRMALDPSPNAEPYFYLKKCVVDLQWRYELISYVKDPAKLLKSAMLNYMLADPESLIYCCMKAKDFERAYQVIELFQMKNTEISQHVQFHEQLQHFQTNPEKIIKFFTSNGQTNVQQQFTNVFDFFLTRSSHINASQSVNIKNHLQDLYTDELDENIRIYYLAYINRRRSRENDNFYEELSHLYDGFLEEENRSIKGNLNKKHASHRIFMEIGELCRQKVAPLQHNVNLFKKCFNYLQAFSHLFAIEENTSHLVSSRMNTSYFHLLDFNRSELIGKLLFELHLDPREFERFFAKLRLDFLYHVAANCFPTINLYVEANLTIEEMYADNLLYTPSKGILIYIQKRNWFLAFLLNAIYNVDSSLQMHYVWENRMIPFENYKNLHRNHVLKQLFDQNSTVAALQNFIQIAKLKLYIKDLLIKLDLISIHSDTNNQVQNENRCKENAKNLCEILENLPERQLILDPELIQLRDDIFGNLISDFHTEFYQFHRAISNSKLRLNTLLSNMCKWPIEFLRSTIRIQLTQFNSDLEPIDLELLKDWLRKIEFCDSISTIFTLSNNWYFAYELCLNECSNALQILIQHSDIRTVLQYLDIFKPQSILIQKLITVEYLEQIFEYVNDLETVGRFLDKFPMDFVEEMCLNVLVGLQNYMQMKFICEYISLRSPSSQVWNQIRVSVKILDLLPILDQNCLCSLIQTPLDIIETLLMNMKFDYLVYIFDELNGIGFETEIDELLRTYAEKSLDFRPNLGDVLVHTPDQKLLQSVDSLLLIESTDFSFKQFVMPSRTPLKCEWIPNGDSSICMCCEQVEFSMFNRRHHCRRCGRLICANCSMNRMLVPYYGDILVRVCQDCFDQTTLGSNVCTDQTLSIGKPYIWLLTNDNAHNTIVREEFTYEQAPSVCLCLSILQFHSEKTTNPKYAHFLRTQCEHLLHCPVDYDYTLIVQMLKTLVMALKLTGDENCDELLAHSDLAQLLANHHYLKLLPKSLKAINLRNLRDILIYKEEWELSLEICMKFGLDTGGIFAAWGKTLLKTGRFQEAREKFQKCFENCNTKHQLLLEIVEILQQTPIYDTSNRLNSLKSIINGTWTPHINNFQEESLYYVSTYGTPLDLIHLYLSQKQVTEAINTILMRKLSTDHFIEVYMYCLKSEKITELFTTLNAWDPDLKRDYLQHLCRYFEQNNYLNCLLQLQDYLGDNFRAAMTCIRFYEQESRSFHELEANAGYLKRAEEFLLKICDQLELKWMDLTYSSSDDFIMHLDIDTVKFHLKTIQYQMSIATLLNRETRKIVTLFGTDSDRQSLLMYLLTIDDDNELKPKSDTVLKLISHFKVPVLMVRDIYRLSTTFFLDKCEFSKLHQLIKCIGNSDVVRLNGVSEDLDQILAETVKQILANENLGKLIKVEELIRLIRDTGTKISTYIHAKQLKNAYFLAVKFQRFEDLHLVLEEAKALQMNNIVKLCEQHFKD